MGGEEVGEAEVVLLLPVPLRLGNSQLIQREGGRGEMQC